MCSLKEFLKTGKLGRVQIDTSLEDIINLLGEPDDTAWAKPKIKIWKYGNLELTFRNEKIILIKIVINHENPQFPHKLTEEIWPINKFMKIESVLDLIDKYEVSWQVRQQGSFNQQLCLVTEGKVTLYIDLDARECCSLFAGEES